MRALLPILCLLPLTTTAETRVPRWHIDIRLGSAPMVRAFMHQAREGRDRVQRPWAGLSGEPVTRDIAEALGMGVPEGVVITALQPDSPFARTGFAVGDVITAVEGVPVDAPAQLVYRMSVAQETDVLVDYIRRGDRGSVLVTMAPPLDLPAPVDPSPDAPPRADPPPRDPPRADTESEREPVLPGLKLVRITPAITAQYGLPAEVSGVVVIAPGQFGTQVGLRTGDVIALINGTRVDTPRMVERALSRPGRFRLSVLRGAGRVVLDFAS